MADTREDLLARLVLVCGAVAGVRAVGRNTLDVADLNRPAVIVQDGIEQMRDLANGARYSEVGRMELSPSVTVFLRAGIGVDPGRLMSLYRSRVVTAVLTDAELIAATGRNGGIRYEGCVALPRGSRSVFFTPVRVRSSLPDPTTQPWPMGDKLPVAPLPPEVDVAKVAASVQAAFEPDDALTAAFVVAYQGRIIGERYRRGIDHNTRLPSWSMGKSVLATLMGQLIFEDVYDLWDPAPVEQWQRADDPRRAIRIADLLRMSSGLRFVAPQDPDFDAASGYPDHLYTYTGAIDAFRWATTRPLQWAPNTVGRYRNSDPLAIGYLIKKAALERREDYFSYPQRHLFDKIGMRRMLIEPDPYGNFLMQGYDFDSARDWVRLGLLYLQDGVWDGERLLPEGWVDFVRTPAPAWSRPIYGGFFWLNRLRTFPVPEDAYYMAGAGGQYAIIVPTHDLVVVRLGHYKGAPDGDKALRRALALLMEAIPQVRPAWQPPFRHN